MAVGQAGDETLASYDLGVEQQLVQMAPVTDAETPKIVHMVYAGHIKQEYSSGPEGPP